MDTLKKVHDHIPLWICGLAFCVLLCNCRNDFEYTTDIESLQFSRDTVVLDTTFVNIGSSTYSFKVYNRGVEDLLIPAIRLGRGEESPYRINVDGASGKTFDDVVLRASDSLYIFVEFATTENPIDSTLFTLEDHIVFEDPVREKRVTLITYVRDAFFLYKGYPGEQIQPLSEEERLGLPNWVEPSAVYTISTEHLEWTGERPVVIYGFARVPEGDTLLISEGSRVYFHQGAGLILPGASVMYVQGAAGEGRRNREKRVRFQQDLLRPDRESVPGQWAGIFLCEGSKARFDHVSIDNASYGISAWAPAGGQAPELSISNSTLLQSSAINLWARNAEVKTVNSIFGNAGIASVYLEGGGPYAFTHSTIANYWTFSFRPGPALYIGQGENPNGNTAPLQGDISLVNCIVDGNRLRELEIELEDREVGRLSFAYSLLKYQEAQGTESGKFYDFSNSSLYRNVLLNSSLDFLDPGINVFYIGSNSAAINRGIAREPGEVSLDLDGYIRNLPPDVGAYEYRPAEAE